MYIYTYNISKVDTIGGQRGGRRSLAPPPFRKKWFENAPKRINFPKFS